VTRYFLGRFGRMILVVFALITVTFVLSRSVGDPVSIMLPLSSTPEDRARVRGELGLDEPLPVQYSQYMGDVLRGDLGDSIWQGTPALPLVLDRLPASFLLAGASVALAILVGLPIGILGGMRPGSWMDKASTVSSSLSLSIPDFWFGIILIFVFSVTLGWFPTSGYGTPAALVLPAIALSLRPGGRLARVAREAVKNEMAKAYVVAGRAKGLQTHTLMWSHVLKNISVVVITVLGYDFLFVFTGYAIGVETVFDWPGVGRLAVLAVLNQDLTLISAIVVVTGIIIALVNMLLDFLAAAIDRRISL
jgi:peptide/nickel transport system permease protein